jgi:nucleotide-binding universal stress UspA family protein
MKMLLAVDGSRSALKAVDCLIDHLDWYRGKPTVELVTVHLPLPKIRNLAKAQVERFYQEEGEEALAMARKKLDTARISYRASVLVGQVAETIAKHAKTSRCELICVGTRGLSELGGLILGSTATKLLHLADRPVLFAK